MIFPKNNQRWLYKDRHGGYIMEIIDDTPIAIKDFQLDKIDLYFLTKIIFIFGAEYRTVGYKSKERLLNNGNTWKFSILDGQDKINEIS